MEATIINTIGTPKSSTPDTAAPSRDDGEIKRLAALPPLKYDRERKDAAKALGVRPGTLDRMVSAERKSHQAETDIDDVEPWDSPVNPAELLSEISETVQRFIVCRDETAHAAALWAAMTWFIDVIQVAPLAVITAPEKRCGKSHLLTLLERLVRRPLPASNITPAAMFRAIHKWQPTLVVDEVDTFMRNNDELRGIINAGHTRDRAFVIRTVGEAFEPQKFSVWGAKALAGIGYLPDTLMDRSIVLELRRKLPHERVERLRHAKSSLFETLSAKLARFAEDHGDAVMRARPDLPAELNDRAQDNWEPLLAIAEVAGGIWPSLAKQAALKLSGGGSPVTTVGVELLADIREMFALKAVDRLSTDDLIAALCADSEKRWGTYNQGGSLNSRQLARIVGQYDISTNKTIRFGQGTAKGYVLASFEDAFLRYLPPVSVTESQPNNDGGLRVTDRHFPAEAKPASVTPKPPSILDCYRVTDKTTKAGPKSLPGIFATLQQVTNEEFLEGAL